MTLNVKTWSQVTAAFERVSELDPADREKVLETFRLEPQVRTWLDQLLAAHDHDDESLIDRTVLGVVDSLSAEAETAAEAASEPAEARQPLPDHIGPWRPVDEIARGGMGIVIRADRDDGQFEQQVAIKLLRSHALNATEQHLLQQEIRLLARLEHPGIARLIDGGLTEPNRPFLVMEYVDGEPIDAWCTRNNATLKQRVDLVIQVCEALAHAHQRLVAHADIKPANVLVDDTGRVRLVDFGIAGLLQASEEAPKQEQLRCSPAWCAPEQLTGEAPRPAQDIFATGALLQRLLTGRRVRDGAAITRWLAGTPAAQPQSHAPSEELLPELRKSRVRGDLDAICLRALADEPEQRYASIEGLKHDLQRWSQRRPVTARPLTAVGRIARFVARNPVPVGAGVIAISALLVGFALSTVNAKQARIAAAEAKSEAMRADSVRDFVLDLFRAADPLRQGGAELSTRQVMATAADALDANVEMPDETRLEILNLLADVQRSLGWHDDAGILLTRAIEIIEPSKDMLPAAQIAETWHQQALLDAAQSDHGKAVERLRQVLEILPDSGDRQVQELKARAHITLGLNLTRTNAADEAAVNFARASEQLGRLDPPAPNIEKLLHGNLGVAAYRAGDYELALEEMQKTLEIQKKLGNSEQGAIVTTLSNLAAIHAQLGQLDKALVRDREALAIARQAFPPGHTMIGRRLYSLGDTLRLLGDYQEALEKLDEARAIQVAAELPAQVELVDLTRVRTMLGMGNFERAAKLAATVGSAMAEREGPLDGVTLLLIRLELAALHAINARSLDAVIAKAEQRVERAMEEDRIDRRGRRLQYLLARIALDRKQPEAAARWLQLSAPLDDLIARNTPIIALSLELRRRTQSGGDGIAELKNYLLDVLDKRTLIPRTSAHIWCALAESAVAGNDQTLIRRALDELSTMATSTRLDALTRSMVARTLDELELEEQPETETSTG